jgi:hypothetical protein
VLSGALVGFLGRDVGGAAGAVPALIGGAVLAGATAMVALVASYIAVEATAADEDGPAAHVDASLSPWALSVVQAVLPLAACAPMALALQTVL